MSERIEKKAFVQQLAKRMNADETVATEWLDATLDILYENFGLDRGIGHFMLFEVDSVARAPVPPILKSRQTSSAASARKTAPQPSSRQAG